MEASDRPQPTPEQLADLSALADGSLPGERRAEVEQAIGASPELTSLYTRERAVAQLLRDSAERERAPLALRERIEADRQRGGRRRTPRRAVWGSGLAGSVAAVVAAVALILSGGTGSPTLAAAAALGTKPITMAVPTEAGDGPGTLDRSVGDVYFPTFAALGYRAVGQRTDTIDGHRAITVFYKGHGGTVAYTILTSPPLKSAHGKTVGSGWILGTRVNGRNVASWRRSGDACVLSSDHIGVRDLTALANAELSGHR